MKGLVNDMKGVYCLVIDLSKKICISVGALGKIRFEKGIYVYVGSAQNNLEKRIERHYSNNKKLWWHIDYFLKNRYTKIKKTLYKIAGKEQEHKLAFELNKIGIPVEKFGSSDCKCSSHLFKIKNKKYLKVLKMETFEK